MGFFNPYGAAIRFLEEQVQPTPPQIVSETVVFSLAESITVPVNVVSETVVFSLAESITVPANPAVVSETITFDLAESVTVTT